MKKVFALLAALTVFLSCAEAQDILSSCIQTAFESGIISGNENGDFEADKPATRAEFAVILTRFLDLRGGINIFSDVSDNDWFFEAAVAAAHNQLLLGDEYGRMCPYDIITCQDAVTAIGRYFHAESVNRSGTEQVLEYAKGYFAYALENDLFKGGVGKEPLEPATKGDILTLLYNYDRQSTARVRFVTGYPNLSTQCEFGSISVELRTNKPCTVYYGLAKPGIPYYSADIRLCEITELNKTIIAKIPANINERYDVYLKLVNSDGIAGRVSVLKDVSSFSVASGDGTEVSPYKIYTKRQLMDIAANPAAHYRLEDNIDVGGIWQPLPEFSGVLDGNGYRISGIVINDNNENAGLFSSISDGEVKNLAVKAEVSAKQNVGIIAGKNEGNISGCTVTGSVEARTNNAGGFCGINSGVIENCLSAVYSVTSGSFAGGISGQNYGSIRNCLAAAEVVASDMYAGGISGANDNGSIKTCVSACVSVYDTMTLNSGRLTTNKKNGLCVQSYCYEDTVSNAAFEEESDFSQNGYDVSWDKLINPDFYYELGWDRAVWSAAGNGYRLPCPENAPEAVLEAGRTVYHPKPVTDEEGLRAIDRNETGHYILAKDITLSVPWKTICAANGFSGTLDGNGYTIYNLNLKSETGMFSNITGGTIKNLTVRNASASPGAGGAILAACNYGYIQNCSVYGKISTKKAGFLGAVAGENYGEISDCHVRVDIVNNFDNATVGGICAENNGIIIGSDYWGTITSKGANAVIGGVCGYDMGGYVFENYVNAEIKANNTSSYVGGICGITSGGQVYKCSSTGRIVVESRENIYVGGVCGLAENAAVYNSLSLSSIYATGEDGYIGGIAGCNSEANIQNTYSAGSVVSAGKVITGGICGYSENGFVMQNVALNPAVNGNSVGAVIGSEQGSEVSDNYSCEKMLLNSARVTTGGKNGIVKSLTTLKGSDFYFKPLSSGGLLGWDIESWTSVRGYSFPVLSGIPNQDTLKMPVYR